METEKNVEPEVENLSSIPSQGISDEELKQMMGNPCVCCAIIDRGFVDTTGISTNLLKMYSELHHKTDNDEPCVLPT